MAFRQTLRRSLLLFTTVAVLAGDAVALPLLPGQAVATCYSGSNPIGDVAGVLDIRAPATNGAIVNTNWNPPRGAAWTLANLGTQVFGIALDDAPSPNIYVTATIVYNASFYPPPPPPAPGRTLGEIYKLGPACSGPLAPGCVFAVLPNSGQGLGNIAYDRKHKQFFVSNFYDGRIYRVSSAGVVAPTPLDPGAPFVGPMPAPIPERVWGVGVFQDRLYFGTWGPPGPGQVYSVAIDPITGDFSGPIDPNGLLPSPTNQPIADIEFSANGRMLIAERGVMAPGDLAFPHHAQVLEFSVGGSWMPTGHQFMVGEYATKTNSAGGVDYVCEGDGVGSVVATGDALHLRNDDFIYGLQIFPAGGGDTTNSFLVDLDNERTEIDKTQIGDVDVYNTCDRQCGELLVERVICETDSQGMPTGKFKILFRVKNLFKEAVFHAFLVGLGSVTANPSYFPVAAGNDGDLDPGEVSQLLTTTISGATPGQALSFQITLHNQDLVECCATRVTVTLPECDCAQVTAEARPYCKFRPLSWSYSFTLQSLFQQANPAFVFIVPDTPKTATFTPNVIPFTGNPQKVSLAIGNASPGQQVCFLVSLHTEDFETCCSIHHCVTLPKWFDDPFTPVGLDDTSLILFGDDLIISDAEGDPGVVLPLVGQTGVDLFWEPLTPPVLGPGDSLEQTLKGRATDSEADSELATTQTLKTSTGAELRASFPALGATRQRWELFREGDRVLTVPDVAGDVPAICNSCGPSITTDAHFSVHNALGTPASVEYPPPCDPRFRCLFAGFTFKVPSILRVGPAGEDVAADEVRVFPENARDTVASFSELTMRASGIPSFTLTGFRGAVDCNANGLDDYDEITRGGGLDLDRDGALDECTAAPQSVVIDLSTGFDQTVGVALTPGAADDDWQLAVPGPERPARVIVTPRTAWPPPLGNSRWVGAEASTGPPGGASTYQYKRVFCLAEGASDVVLRLELLADDRAKVFLNGQEISGLGGAFRGAPLVVQRSGTAGDGLFFAGDNTLTVRVRDPGKVVTGFTLTGSVTASAGACQP